MCSGEELWDILFPKATGFLAGLFLLGVLVGILAALFTLI